MTDIDEKEQEESGGGMELVSADVVFSLSLTFTHLSQDPVTTYETADGKTVRVGRVAHTAEVRGFIGSTRVTGMADHRGTAPFLSGLTNAYGKQQDLALGEFHDTLHLNTGILQLDYFPVRIQSADVGVMVMAGDATGQGTIDGKRARLTGIVGALLEGLPREGTTTAATLNMLMHGRVSYSD
jgi:hypothetical protein